MKIAFLVAMVVSLLLAACDGESEHRSTRKLSAAEMLAQVRAAGTVGDELDVQPLREMQVEDLRLQASAAEARGDWVAAEQALAQALRLVPGDPDLLQGQAEVALAARDWTRAQILAGRAYESGPRLGSLCRRSWLTIRFAREAQGDEAGAAQARQQLAACTVAPPVRM